MKGLVGITAVFSLFIACASTQSILERDGLGRIHRISTVERGEIVHVEEIKFVKNTRNPSESRFFRKEKGLLRHYREGIYVYTDNRLSRLNYYRVESRRKLLSGFITYEYLHDRPALVSYYRLDPGSSTFYLASLDTSSVEPQSGLRERRLIEYAPNEETGTIMQVGQYVIRYRDGRIESMKSWTLEKKSKKIIEKMVHAEDEVIVLVTALEERFLKAIQE